MVLMRKIKIDDGNQKPKRWMSNMIFSRLKCCLLSVMSSYKSIEKD